MRLTIIAVLAVIIASCSNERRFVKFHDKNDPAAAKHCASWYPNRDSIHESTFFKEGETKYIPGQVVYANCDSAYIAALDEAVRLGNSNIRVSKVAVPCPPSKEKHDTVFKIRSEYVRNTAMEVSLRYDMVNANRDTEKYKQSSDAWEKRSNRWRNWTFGELSLILLVIALSAYRWWKSK